MEIKKIQNHKDELQIFRDRIVQDSLILNIKEKSILHYIEMLTTEIEKNIAGCVPAEAKSNELNGLQRKWLMLFKEGWEKASGTELITRPKPEQFKMMEHALALLAKNNSSLEAYMKYLFEEYYPENNHTLSFGIGLTVSNHILQKFFLDTKEQIKKTSDEDKAKKDLQDTFAKFQELYKNPENSSRIEELKRLLGDYKSQKITATEFKEKVINF